MRKRPLLLIACVFLTGLVYQRYSLGIVAAMGLALIFREWYYGSKADRDRKKAGRSILLLSAFLFAIFHMHQEDTFRNAYMSKIMDGDRVTVWGELIKTETTDYGYRGHLSDCYIDFGEGRLPCNDILVYTSKDHFQIGQIHRITGKVNMFAKARNEGNFDARLYYQSLKIDFAVEEEESACIGVAEGKWKTFLFSLKEKMGNVYQLCLSKRAFGFYQAMVLGNKIDLDENLKDLFLIGGISHILAISGLHVSTLGRGMYRFLRKGGIGFGLAGLCGSAVLISYCIMVGGSVSTIRAVGMMLLFFLAQWLGRSYDMLNALGGMVLLLLWDNPYLIENSGFWFSVTALLGVGFVGKNFSDTMEGYKREKIISEKEIKKINAKKSIRESIKKRMNLSGFWMSLGITLTTLPVTALSYYEIPLYAPIVNFVVLPLLTPVFCLAIAGGFIGALFPLKSVVKLLLLPCEWLLYFYEGICELVSNLPFANLICGKPELGQVVLYYIFLFGGSWILVLWKKQKRKKKREQALLLITTLLCGICIFFPKEKAFEITFLDVGQGDGVYLCAEDGTTCFIDGGSSNVKNVGTDRILPFLKAKGIASIDYWFVSHADSDHVSGIYEVLEEGYEIRHLVISELCSEDAAYDNLRRAARLCGTKVLHMSVGDQVCSKNMEITCVGPLAENKDPVSGDRNENSLVLLLKHRVDKNSYAQTDSKEQAYFRAIFAGDISTEAEEELCKSGLLCDVDLVKANHHGSNYSNSDRWFAVLKPEYVVVSCSKNNLYGHPGANAVSRMEASGAKIFYTMENGQIQFPLIQ